MRINPIIETTTKILVMAKTHLVCWKVHLSILIKTLSKNLFSKYFTCFVLGGGKKVSTGGINKRLIKNKAMIFNPDTQPNSFNKGLLVSAKTKKPMAAVILQNNVTMPILPTICSMASCLFFDSL